MTSRAVASGSVPDQTDRTDRPDPAVTYASYLRLDELLAAQAPRTDEHDELLFIVIHQVYELWFKQLLHEEAELRRRLARDDVAQALHTLGRMRAILKTVVSQIDVLETLTPLEFLSFRDRLERASGFQSAQFRRIERALPELLPLLLETLGRRGHTDADEEERLIAAYRSDAGARQLCEAFVDLDEGLQEWRYRHVKMVERTIGAKVGTGGSAGAEYLRRTLFRPVFAPLWAIRSRL